MKSVVKWQGKVHFVAETDSGHQINIDGAPSIGGENKGARPMELILAGLGGCSSIDVVTMLQKSRQDVTDCRVEIAAERADAVPAVFTKINMHFVVTGRGLKESHVKRAVSLSAEKYCSVSIMLSNGDVEITHSHEIIEA
ncbi:osmotically inducible protein C [Pokkaliibacter plantistimulans]|uniref:Osmotically inducible protein C n=1 Tax=Pokkaliibacter plantistimulans TaxID=1635171 RepID=A0ABX5LYZ5_9GAMM|nr:OsmC family protein [Pokkaliibacter plantistimulans]PXF30403.1 osmotically inducible protein C [Pokkaliibacter plantistimulans]